MTVSKRIVLVLCSTLLMLSFVGIFAYATDDNSVHTHSINEKWEGLDDGEFFGNDQAGKGNMYAAVGEDGNVYSIWEPKNGDGDNAFDSALDRTLRSDREGGKCYKYNVYDYPYMMLDLDVMTPSGKYGDAMNFKMRYSNMTGKTSAAGSNLGYLVNFGISDISDYLNTVPYRWQHVSIIFEYAFNTDSTGFISSASINMHVFVNGELKTEIKGNSISSLKDVLAEEVGAYLIRIMGVGGESDNAKTAIDNLCITYFSKDYGDTGDMATAVFNSEYKLPYGKTVARILDKGFDSLSNALQALNDGDTLILTSDVYEYTEINRPIRIDRNGENGELYSVELLAFADTLDVAEENGIITATPKNEETEKYRIVKWCLPSGEVIFESEAEVGSIAEIPSDIVIEAGDGYRKYSEVNWIGESGKIGDLSVGDGEGDCIFTAVIPSESAIYEGHITNAKLSMIYYSDFELVFYLPVFADVTVDRICYVENGEENTLTYDGTVKIDGEDFYSYKKRCTTVGAAEAVEVTVHFEIDGVSYTDSFEIGALVYAKTVLDTDPCNDIESKAVGNMVRYIKEAVLYSDEAADTTAFDELITKSKIAGYATEYTDTADYSEIAEYLTSISFTITDGVASYKIVLTDASYANTVAVSTDDKTFELEVNDATVIVKSARVYDVIDTITVTINGASGTYSILENIEGVAAAGGNTGLLKALYEFGVAEKEYRQMLEN